MVHVHIWRVLDIASWDHDPQKQVTRARTSEALFDWKAQNALTRELTRVLEVVGLHREGKAGNGRGWGGGHGGRGGGGASVLTRP